MRMRDKRWKASGIQPAFACLASWRENMVRGLARKNLLTFDGLSPANLSHLQEKVEGAPHVAEAS